MESLNPPVSQSGQKAGLRIASTYQQKFKSYGKIYFLFHKKKIANELLGQLKQISSGDIAPSAESKKIVEASKWFLINILNSQMPFFNSQRKSFSEALMALKLGVPLDVLQNEKNKGLISFLSRNHLIRPMDCFDHKAQAGDGGVIQLLVNGDYMSWKELEQEVGASHLDYNYQGIIVRNKDNEYKALPLLILPKKNEVPESYKGEIAPDKPEMELILKNDNEFGHSWLRLKHPDGKVYSFGLYRKQNYGVSLFQQLSKAQGMLISPDYHEFNGSGSTRKSESKPITQKEFDDLLEKFEDLTYREGLTYEALDKNCAKWAVTSFEGKMHAKDKYKEEKANIEKSYKIRLSKLKTPLVKNAGIWLKFTQSLFGRGRELEKERTGKKYKFTKTTYNYKVDKKKTIYSPIDLHNKMGKQNAYLGNEMKMQKKYPIL